MTRRLLTIQEAAEYLGLGQTKARQILEKMEATRKFGRSVRFDINAIDNWLDQETNNENK